jgi:hypothetical protein
MVDRELADRAVTLALQKLPVKGIDRRFESWCRSWLGGRRTYLGAMKARSYAYYANYDVGLAAVVVAMAHSAKAENYPSWVASGCIASARTKLDVLIEAGLPIIRGVSL